MLRKAKTLELERSDGLFGFDVLGVRVHAVQISEVVALLEKWLTERVAAVFGPMNPVWYTRAA